VPCGDQATDGGVRSPSLIGHDAVCGLSVIRVAVEHRDGNHGQDGRELEHAVVLGAEDHRLDVTPQQRLRRLGDQLRPVGGVDDHRHVTRVPGRGLNALQRPTGEQDARDAV
jgi:hypothetical protein